MNVLFNCSRLELELLLHFHGMFYCFTGGIYWKNPSSPASQIETAAYALMVYARQNTKDSIKIGIRILKWLVQRTTPYGGFRSTQVLKCIC